MATSGTRAAGGLLRPAPVLLLRPAPVLLLLAWLVAVPAGPVLAAPAADVADGADGAGHRVAFSYQDPAITESSGLAARGGVMFTVNDSGDGPRVYAVDPGTGATVGVTTYSEAQVVDVEAVAPGSTGVIWVGDIGDNSELRTTVDLYRVPVGQPRGDHQVAARRYGLAYPDGPHDAETLLVHPRTGRAYLVSKGILGGTVYAAPTSLVAGSVNRLRQVGQVPGVVTDGAFLPGGRHVVLRGYGDAAVYTFPGLRQVGRLPLPEQEQGEAVAVDEAGRVFVGTEGVHTDVLRVRLPQEVRAAIAGPGPVTPPSGPASPAGEAADPAPDRSSVGDGVRVAGGLLLVTLAGWVLLTASRRRSRRRP